MHVLPTLVEFLRQQRDNHNCKDLLDFYLQFDGALETQLNVAAGNGHPVQGRTSTYEDDTGNEWWNIRIPRQADSEPNWDDYDLKWPIELHAEAIGSTGWDWRARVSRYIGFDFDAIAGHAQGVGVSDDALDRVRQAAQDLPYVTTRRSTGGAGLHLYAVFADPVPTANHTEHAALARAVLGMMSHEAGFDFGGQIDACGGNMWIWHRKSNKENQGLALIKAGEPLACVPSNWRDHLDVVSRKRAKIKLAGINDQDEGGFDTLTSAHRAIPLDEGHHAHIAALERAGCCCVWVQDHHLLQTHTVGFRQIADDPQFAIKGLYKTNSNGKDLATPNCFAFPMSDSSWRIYRFSPGIAEAETWEQDGKGWTNCAFNRLATLKTAARALNAKELKKGFEFETLADAAKALETTGVTIDVPDAIKDRKTIVKRIKEGQPQLQLQVAKIKPKHGVPGDPDNMGNWTGADVKDMWSQIIDGSPVDNTPNDTSATNTSQLDRVRALTTIGNQSAGWAIQQDSSIWMETNLTHSKSVLASLGFTKADIEIAIGMSIRNAWTLIKLPFQPEYPGGRQWNLKAPQFRFPPAPRPDSGESGHPTWDTILAHIGRDLDEAIASMPWARRANITTGAEYLRLWLACTIRDPFQPLPYLFLFGPENCGKSILWEAFDQILVNAVVRADLALTNSSGYNGEIDGAIVCVVEERNLTKHKDARERLRDAVTSQKLSIRRMRTDCYQSPNTTHWIQTANDLKYCPVFPGDTRITMISVGAVENEIPKKTLLETVAAEGPAFLRTLLDLTLPPLEGRLRIPVINTDSKKRAEEIGRPAIEEFLAETVHNAPGEKVKLADLHEKYSKWAGGDASTWLSDREFRKRLPEKYPGGTSTGNVNWVGNISLTPMQSLKPYRYVRKDGKLVKEPRVPDARGKVRRSSEDAA